MDNPRTFYQPAQGDTAATVAQGYDNNFQALREEVTAGDAATLESSNRYTASAVSALLDSAPAALDTLRKIAAALGDDPHFSATVMQLLGQKATQSEVNSALAGKLDKTGGDIDGDLDVKGQPAIRDGGRIRFGRDNSGAYFNSIDASGVTTAQIRLWNNGRCTFWKPGPGADFRDIWHSGNDGAGSGLDADLWHGMQLWRGTQAQYAALPAKDPDTLYIVTE